MDITLTGNAVDTVDGLIALITDAAASKKHHAELKAVAAEADQKMVTLEEATAAAHADIAAKNAKADERLAEATKRIKTAIEIENSYTSKVDEKIARLEELRDEITIVMGGDVKVGGSRDMVQSFPKFRALRPDISPERLAAIRQELSRRNADGRPIPDHVPGQRAVSEEEVDRELRIRGDDQAQFKDNRPADPGRLQPQSKRR